MLTFLTTSWRGTDSQRVREKERARERERERERKVKERERYKEIKNGIPVGKDIKIKRERER